MRIKLREARQAARMTQGALALESDVPQPVICGIETGKRREPTIQTVARLARALGCTIDSLIEWEEADG